MIPPKRLSTTLPTRPTTPSQSSPTPTPTEKSKPVDHEIKRAVAKLKALVGNITTTTQIITASHWLDKIRLDPESLMNDQAWMLHVPRDDPDFLQIWDRLSFYRILGEPVDFVIPNDWKPNDREMDELGLLNERWVFLAAEGELGDLEDNDFSRAVKERGGTLAERLKAYLESYKSTVGFETWNEEYIENAKRCVIEVYDAFFQRTGRPHYKSDGPTGAQIHRNIASITTTEVPYQDILDEAAQLPIHFGRLQTTEEVGKAAAYSDPLFKGPRAVIQQEAFEHYVLRNLDSGRVTAEIEIFKLIGESSAYFGSAQHFNVPAMQELAKFVRDWVVLEYRGVLRFLKDKGYHGPSVAADMKHYMEAYKSHEKITRLTWAVEDLKGLRLSLLTDPLGVIGTSDPVAISTKRAREPTLPLEVESVKRMKASAFEALSLLDPAVDNQQTSLQTQHLPLPSHVPQPAEDPMEYVSPFIFQPPTIFPDSPGATKSTSAAMPRDKPTYLKRVEDIIQNYNKSGKKAASMSMALDVAFKKSETAKPLRETRRNELSKATGDMHEFAKSPEFANSEQWMALLEKISALGKEIKDLSDVIAAEGPAREKSNAARDEHRQWKMKMEALDRAIDGPEFSSG